MAAAIAATRPDLAVGGPAAADVSDWGEWVTAVQTSWSISGDVLCHGWLSKKRHSVSPGGDGEWWERYLVLRRGGLLGWFPQPPTDEVAATLPLRWVYVSGGTIRKMRYPAYSENKGPLFALSVQEEADVPVVLLGCDDERTIDLWHRRLIAASLRPHEELAYIPWCSRVSGYVVESVALSSRGVTKTAESVAFLGNALGTLVERAFSGLGEWVGSKLVPLLGLPDDAAASQVGNAASQMFGAATRFSLLAPGVFLSAVGRYGGGARRPRFSSVCRGQICSRLTALFDIETEARGAAVSEILVCDGCGAMPVKDEGCLLCRSRFCTECFDVHTAPPVVHPIVDAPALRREEERAVDAQVIVQAESDRVAYQERMREARQALLARAAALGPTRYPTAWSAASASSPRGFQLCPIEDMAKLRGLQACLATRGSALGHGRDVTAGLPDYNRLQLAGAWRIEHQLLWPKYCAAKAEVVAHSASVAMPAVSLQNEVESLGDDLNDWAVAVGCALHADVNEKLVAHGTKPENVATIVHTGMNERFCGGAFGRGCYLAENCGKCDQYATVDSSYGSHPELHNLLYKDHERHHPGDVYYIFLCRTVLGTIAHTIDGNTEQTTRASVWATPEKRELAAIPGSHIRYHSLLVETGAAVQRYREIVTFHGDRILPEILIAYKRDYS